jgi:hypothetical protein
MQVYSLGSELLLLLVGYLLILEAFQQLLIDLELSGI